jgi:hypothetical protein
MIDSALHEDRQLGFQYPRYSVFQFFCKIFACLHCFLQWCWWVRFASLPPPCLFSIFLLSSGLLRSWRWERERERDCDRLRGAKRVIGLLIPRDVVYGSILTALVWSHEYESRGSVGNSRLMSNCQFLSTYIAIHSCPWDQIFARYSSTLLSSRFLYLSSRGSC